MRVSPYVLAAATSASVPTILALAASATLSKRKQYKALLEDAAVKKAIRKLGLDP